MEFLYPVGGALVGVVLGLAWRRRRRRRTEGIELLLLLSAPRVLTAEHLRAAAREAFGREPDTMEAKAPVGILRIDGYTLVALPVAEPMVDDPEPASESIPELRMRIAFAEHRAYVVVSCRERPRDTTRADAFARVGRLAAALADDTTRLVYAPEAGKGLLANEATLEGLRGGDPLATMETINFDAIGMVSGEDPRMVAATAEARRRLPEFVVAVRTGRNLELCIVKAPFTDGRHTEFMGVEAASVEGETIRGTLMNEPFRVRGLKQGAPVEIAFADVSDWAYPGEREMVGPFTEGIVGNAL